MIPIAEPPRQLSSEDSEGEIVIDDVDYSLSSDESRSPSPLINTMVQMEGPPEVSKASQPEETTPVIDATEPQGTRTRLDLISDSNLDAGHISALIDLERQEQEKEHSRRLQELVHEHEKKMKELDIEIRLKEMEHETNMKKLDAETRRRERKHERMLKIGSVDVDAADNSE